MPFKPRQSLISPRWRLGNRQAPLMQGLAWALLMVFAYGQAVHCCLDLKRWLGAAQQVQVVLAGLQPTQDSKSSDATPAAEMPACHRKPLASLPSQGVGEGAASIQNEASLIDADTRCICLCPDESSALALASGPAFSTELPVAVEFGALHQPLEPRQAPIAFNSHGQAPPGRTHGAPVYLLTLQILV
jgi:hypothetical protein